MGIIRQWILWAVTFIGLWGSTLQSDRQPDWWETTLMYQIYPRSFKDSNGDGIGDLRGIYEKLDYIKDIGVDTVWIQPFYESPMVDMGYDVSDFEKIDPMFGTMEDYKELVRGIHDRGMKLVVDFVPNHMSVKSDWFRLSEDGVEPYKDFFIWNSGKTLNDTHTTYPNNWLSVFGGSAWTWSEKRKQYYYKQFAPLQPDLNYRSPVVYQKMMDVMKFWLDTGVDGFRIDAIKHVYEASHLKDEPVVGTPSGTGNDFEMLDHIYTMEQPENYVLTHDWRLMLDEYSKKDGKTRLLATEDYDTPQKLVKYMGNSSYPNVHLPFFFGFVRWDINKNAKQLNKMIQEWTHTLPKGALPNWVLDNHDNPRVSSRFTPESVDAWNMMALLLPGTACVYYGSEIGMEDSPVRDDQRKDPNNGGMGRSDSRDPERAPMLWDDTKNAGFTTNDKPWLPVNPGYWRKNVKVQQQDPNSHLNIFKRLSALRKTPIIKEGTLNSYALSEWTYMFTRSHEKETIAVLVNLGTEPDPICAKRLESSLPDTMFVHTSSINSGLKIGDKVRISEADRPGQVCTELRPRAGVVLSTSHGALLSYSLYLIFLTTASTLLRWNCY
nr:PREDICTED: alpha-glucosidase-like [Bemisia tabaci]